MCACVLDLLRDLWFDSATYIHAVHRRMNDWHIAYILGALNPVFLIVNILITSLEICSASVAAAGTQVFCVNLLKYLSVTARTSPVSPTTTTPLPTSTGSMAPCNIVHSMLDLETNSTIMYTVDMCATTTPFTTTTMMARAAQRSGARLTKYLATILR